MKPEIFYYKQFKPNINGHGGEKRTFQISTLINKLSLSVNELNLSNDPIKTNLFMRTLGFIINYRSIKKMAFINLSFKSYRHISTNLLKIKKQIPNINSNSILFYEHSPETNWLLPIYFRLVGCKVICFPHNIESLANKINNQLTLRNNELAFIDELTLFKNCDLIFTISREEEWLLNLFGTNSFYFPFNIDNTELANSSIQIKDKRKRKKFNNNFLIFGNVKNGPTKEGMKTLLDHITKLEQYSFTVAGFGTESLKYYAKNNIIVLGEVSHLKLLHLYTNTDAIIIHQPPTTGALTRIIECLEMDVPIIANVNASRDNFDKSSLITYRDLSELNQILYQFKVYYNNKSHTLLKPNPLESAINVLNKTINLIH